MAAPLHIVRKPLVNTAAIRADWVHYAGLSRDRTAEIHEPETQVLITLGGAFHYHVGRARRLVDANRQRYLARALARLRRGSSRAGPVIAMRVM
jgi:hypothetical protein